MLDSKICGGVVLDGSGESGKHADVGVSNGKIVMIGDLADVPSVLTIDAGGRVVTPGFIDLHRHADAAIFDPAYGDADLYQGITTVGNGNCGLSVAPTALDGEAPYREAIAAYAQPITGSTRGIPTDSVAAYLDALDRRKPPVNALLLAGSGTIRAAVKGYASQTPNEEELQRIHRLLEQSLRDGAKGVSLGLGYATDCFYTTDELIRALAPIRNTDTVLSVHLREEAMRLLPSIDEMLTVAKALRVPLQISHLKATGKVHRGWLALKAVEKIAAAREDGIDVLCDVYCYPAGSTQLMHVLPPSYLAGGTAALTERLKTPSVRRALRDAIQNGRDFDNYTYLLGWENIYIAAVKNPADAPLVGRSIAEAAPQDPTDFALDLLCRNDCEVTMIDFLTCEEDIETILKSPYAYAISDATFPSGGRLHPRVYGAFATVLETYVRRRRALTLPEAIRKLSRMPADRYGLTQKGRIEINADADICVFDPAAVRVNATYQTPDRPASGMDWVLVDGTIAIANGKRTEKNGGKALRRS